MISVKKAAAEVAKKIVDEYDASVDGYDELGVNVKIEQSAGGSTITFSHQNTSSEHTIHVVGSIKYPKLTKIRKADVAVILVTSFDVGDPMAIDFDAVVRRVTSKTSNIYVLSMNVDGTAGLTKLLKLVSESLFNVAWTAYDWTETNVGFETE